MGASIGENKTKVKTSIHSGLVQQAARESEPGILGAAKDRSLMESNDLAGGPPRVHPARDRNNTPSAPAGNAISELG